MFNLGYKEVILNSVDGISSDGSFVSIDGYFKIPSAEMQAATKTSPSDAVAEVSTWTDVSDAIVGDQLIVQIKLTKINNDKSRKITFTAKGNDEAAIIAGYKKYVAIYAEDDVVTIAAGLKITINAGYERFIVSSVTLTALCLKCTAKGSINIDLTKKVNTAGKLPVGQGWQIEESRRQSSFLNSGPYVQQHGGNSRGVYIDKTYTAYDVKHVVDDSLSHEYVKHAFVNADTPSDDIKLVIYVMEDAVSDFDNLVATAPTPIVSRVTNGSPLSIAVAGTGSVSSAVQYSQGAGTGALTYASADNAIATVDASGVVTGVAAGSTTITATSVEDTGFSGTTAVTVA